MFTHRIKTIASLVDKDASVLDVGCDHAYLPIYLVQNKLCKKVIASDISEKVVNVAKENIKEANLTKEIPVYLSDGTDSIEENYDTLVIAGMGYSTIKKILKGNIISDTIIIQTNSEHSNLRKFMNISGYKIAKEEVILDKKKYYVIIKYVLGTEKLAKRYLLFGKSGNTEYFEYLIKKNKKLIKDVPLRKKIKFIYHNIILKKLLKENRISI